MRLLSCPACKEPWPQNLRKGFRRLKRECPRCFDEKEGRIVFMQNRFVASLEAYHARMAKKRGAMTVEQMQELAKRDIDDLYGPATKEGEL